MDYIELKLKTNPNRKAFLEFLKQNKIDFWITSVENRLDNEFHIYTDQNEEYMVFKEYLTPKNKEYYNFGINILKLLFYNL